MKQATFNIRQNDGNLKQKQGYIFHLFYPKRFTFVTAQESNSINSSMRWNVSELSTGFAVYQGKWDGTRKAAIEQAEKILRKVGAAKFAHTTRSVIELHGKAN